MRTNRAKKGLGILGSILAGVLSHGCADSPKFSKQFNATYLHEGGRPVASVGYKQDNLSGICLVDDKKLEAKVQGFEDAGKFRYESLSIEGLSTSEESPDQNRQFLKVKKGLRLGDASDKSKSFAGFAHVAAMYDESCTKTSEDNVTVDTNTKISGIDLGLSFAHIDRARIGVGYNTRKEEDTVTINVGGKEEEGKFNASIQQFSVDGEAVFDAGNLQHNVGGCVTWNYGDTIESTTMGDLWYMCHLNENTSATLYNSWNDGGNEFSVILTSGDKDYDKLNAIREYIRNKRSGALNTLNLANGPAIEKPERYKKYDLCHLILTSSEAGIELKVLGEHIFKTPGGTRQGITYGFSFKDTGEFGGLLGVKFVK